ncbi:hypothetical protein [Clostridium butanoliproducens]|uniref:hypothetical protein n=1 Tax=Clostridium butanoliproducens TaxID=2991837 RepID=UPI0024BBB0AE|nr:hypothetical protein [Clostridium butanoliproducens]
MINSNYKIPLLYKKMDERGWLDKNNKSYLWLNEMEWMTIDEIKEYEYDDRENKLLIPFAFTGGGDKWVWVVDDVDKEYYVGFCPSGEWNGNYYAKNTEDAIFRQTIEYVSDSNFYLIKEESKSYQVGEEELKKQLTTWGKNFQGVLNNEYLNVIDMLSQLSLKYTKNKYGEWYALLSIEEQDELIEKYIKFDLLDEEFEWYIE